MCLLHNHTQHNKKLSYRRETRTTPCISWNRPIGPTGILLYEYRKQISLGSTFSHCHVLFHYLHSFVHTSLH